MSGPDLDGSLITAIGNFATTAVSPLAILPMAVAAYLWRPPQTLRLAGTILGILLAVPDLLSARDLLAGAAALVGSVAATLLLAELLLTIVIPVAVWVRALWGRYIVRDRRPH